MRISHVHMYPRSLASRGIWSGCLEVGALDFTASDGMVQRILDASAYVDAAMRSPLSWELLRRKAQAPRWERRYTPHMRLVGGDWKVVTE